MTAQSEFAKNELIQDNNCIAKAVLSVLKQGFYKLGIFVGTHSLATVVIATILCLVCSCGIFTLKDFSMNTRENYTPQGAKAFHEEEQYRYFFSSKGGEPYSSATFITANDGGSLLREEYMQAVAEVTEYMENNITVIHEGLSYTYSDICSPYCQGNALISILNVMLQTQNKRIRSGNEFDTFQIRIDYPVSRFMSKDWRIADAFYGVKRRENFTELDWTRLATPIEHVSLIILQFRAECENRTRCDVLRKWETTVHERLQQLDSSLITASIIGQYMIDLEVLRSGIVTVPYFGLGFVFMVIFAVGTVALSSALQAEVGLGDFKPCVVIAGVISPVMATGAAFGLLIFAGYSYDSILVVTPFLVLAIGVDDAFLMIHAWQRCKEAIEPHEKLANVLEEIGPSILITSLTNALGFAIGISTSTQTVQLFCTATSLAIAIDFVYEVTFFAAILAFSHKKSPSLCCCDKPNQPNLTKPHLPKKTNRVSVETAIAPPPKKVKRSKKFFQQFGYKVDDLLQAYCNLISQWPSLIAILVCVFLYWTVAIAGVFKMEVSLSTSVLFLPDSALYTIDIYKTDYIWSENYPVTVFVNKAPNFRNSTQRRALKRMVAEFETLPEAVGSDSTQLWLTDYEEYQKYVAANMGLCKGAVENENVYGGEISIDYDSFFDFSDAPEDVKLEAATNALAPSNSMGMPLEFSYDCVEMFFKGSSYRYWDRYVNWSKNKHFQTGEQYSINSFLFLTAYQNIPRWDQRTNLMLKWRHIAEKYSQFNVSVWCYDAFLYDQLLSLKYVTFMTLLYTFICMAVICLLLIPNLSSVVFASLSVGSIGVGIYGFLCWWGEALSPISLASLIMSMGLSVDFTSHISYHYFVTNSAHTPAHRLYTTLCSVGWPMIQAGFSTVLCVGVLCVTDSYMGKVFLKTVLLVISFGLFHGLIVLPAILTSLQWSSPCSTRLCGKSSVGSDIGTSGSDTSGRTAEDNQESGGYDEKIMPLGIQKIVENPSKDIPTASL